MDKFDFDSQDLSEKLSEVKKKAGLLSFFRLIVFAAQVVFFVLAISAHILWGVLLLFSLWLFIYLVQQYTKQKDQEAIFISLEKIQENSIKRKTRKLQGFDSGTDFLDKSHPFCNDLDLFGDHSLFQLVNHTVSTQARSRLAELMKDDLDKSKADDLREASQELARFPKFLRAMESVGLAFHHDEKSVSTWTSWLNEKEKVGFLVKILAFVGPTGGLAISILIYLGIIPSVLLGLWIIIGIPVLGMVFKPLMRAAQQIPSRNQMKTYRYWLAVLESQNFDSPKLKELDFKVAVGELPATELLNRFDRLGLWVQNRKNVIYAIINLIFWTDFYLFFKLATWKNNHGQLISTFPDKLVDWEVMVSLGAFQHEVGVKGKVFSQEKGLSAKALYHPLLDPEKAVANDFTLEESHHVILLTGSNMSGKTTFMRTLGINCVLVNMGLLPFAEEFGFGDFQLYTSMRNTDNLGESVSSFYAELSRIKRLIDRIENGEIVFFLLDEILKGTNTEDRISGSEALIRQIAKTNALGVISTHDIELAALEKRMPGVINYSFHSEIHDQNIDFDYKIKSGACPSFNAHKLMELMGIKFQENQ